MHDLISRQAAIDSIEKHIRTGDEPYLLTRTDKILNHAFEIAASCVYNLSAADVVPVRHGQWEQDEIAHGLNVWLCSACGQPTQLLDGDVSAKTPYCPNCGAKMDGGAIGDPMEDDLK